MKKEVVLEPSTNSHKILADEIKATPITESILMLDVKGSGIVTHGEHGTLKTESKRVIKYVQQEYNPVSRAIQNAVD